MYVVQDNQNGGTNVLKITDGTAEFVCTISGVAHGAMYAWGDNPAPVAGGEQQDHPNLAVVCARILCIELERRDAMK